LVYNYFRRRSIKIGVISDTHAISEVPSAILNALATVDLIVHAGDFTEKAVLDGLTAIGQVKAVSGNMDSQELKKALPRHISHTSVSRT
jgi:putative phosphoesterase